MAYAILRVLATVTTAITMAALFQAPAHADEPTAITGVVTSNNGSTSTDACVTAFKAETPVEIATVCVDLSGHFAVPVEPGAYKVRIRASGFPEQWYFAHSTWERATRLEISEGGLQVYIELRDGFADITGHIVDSSGTPVEDATVTAESVASGGQQWASTDVNGKYTIVDLAPGQYRIRTFAYGRGAQYAFATKLLEEAAIFDLSDGEVLVVDDALLPLSTVEVVMTDEKNGRRITRGCVSIHDVPGGDTCENADGVFILRNVPADSHEVEAQPEGTHWPATQAITVEPGETHRVTIPVERATAFITSVTESGTGTPAAGVCIQLAEPNLSPSLLHHGCSDDNGRLVIGPLEGAVKTQFYAMHPEDRYGAQWVGVKGGTGDQRQARMFAADADEVVPIDPIRVDPPGSITGIVRDTATGSPVRHVCAFPFALSSTGALDRQAGPHCSDTDGRYTITGLGPYAWPVLHIAVFQPKYAWLWSGGASDRFAARYIRVQPGGTSTADLSLVPAGSITGRAFTADGGVTFAHAIIARNARTGDLADAPTTTGFDGSYVLRALASQNVTIEYFIGMTCWYDRVKSPARAADVQVRADATTTGIDLVDCSR